MGLPQWLSGKESAPQYRRCRFDPWVGKFPRERNDNLSQGSGPGESHGHRSQVDYSPRCCKELDTTEQACTYQVSSTIPDRAGISSLEKVLLDSAAFRAIWALEDDCLGGECWAVTRPGQPVTPLSPRPVQTLGPEGWLETSEDAQRPALGGSQSHEREGPPRCCSHHRGRIEVLRETGPFGLESHPPLSLLRVCGTAGA